MRERDDIVDTELEQEPYQQDFFVVFDSLPGPEGGRFVEVETADGRSVWTGGWTSRPNGMWALGPFIRPENAAGVVRGDDFASGYDLANRLNAVRIRELEGTLLLYRTIAGDTLEWLDGHAAPKVTREQIKGRLFSIQRVAHALLVKDVKGA